LLQLTIIFLTISLLVKTAYHHITTNTRTTSQQPAIMKNRSLAHHPRSLILVHFLFLLLLLLLLLLLINDWWLCWLLGDDGTMAERCTATSLYLVINNKRNNWKIIIHGMSLLVIMDERSAQHRQHFRGCRY
jgi:bacteriorhodopsin